MLGTLALAYPQSREAVQRAVSLAQIYHLEIFLDLNWRPVFWSDPELACPLIAKLLTQVTWLKLTDEEADIWLQTQDPQVIAQHLPNLRGVFVTAGARGCSYWHEGQAGEFPAFVVDTVDTMGAGDGFTAGILHQLCQVPSQPIAEIVRYASAVGALTTTQAGAMASQPTGSEVAEFLQVRQLQNLGQLP